MPQTINLNRIAQQGWLHEQAGGDVQGHGAVSGHQLCLQAARVSPLRRPGQVRGQDRPDRQRALHGLLAHLPRHERPHPALHVEVSGDIQ